jgi:hypothetical protein
VSLGASRAQMAAAADLKLVSAVTSRDSIAQDHQDSNRRGVEGEGNVSHPNDEIDENGNNVSHGNDETDESENTNTNTNTQKTQTTQTTTKKKTPLHRAPVIAASLSRREFLWLAASTHAGEEAACARVHVQLREHFPALLTCIVPRHVERSSEIRAELRRAGLDVRSFSAGLVQVESS